MKLEYSFNGKRNRNKEFHIVCTQDGKRYPMGDYFTNDKKDAEDTLNNLRTDAVCKNAGKIISEPFSTVDEMIINNDPQWKQWRLSVLPFYHAEKSCQCCQENCTISMNGVCLPCQFGAFIDR